MMVSSGMHLDGVCLPTPDTTDSPTLLAGVAKRFATLPPTPDPSLLAELKAFTADWVRNNVKPLSPDTDTSFETWIKDTSYTEARKAELTKLFNESGPLTDADAKVKMFMKAESYTDFKHARAINSRMDRFKVEVGPIFHLIEKELFQNSWFIKKIPVADRAKYVFDRLYKAGARYLASDYKSFEALFTKEIMDAVEFVLYDWATSSLPEHDKFMETVKKYLGGSNKIQNKNISLLLGATRMSGEMCTSLGNGFSNLMFILFLCHKLGSTVVGVVEGDDGLFRIDGPIPTKDDYAKLGLIAKLEIHEHLNQASFCGQIFDTESMTVITDPRKVLASFGWIDRQYFASKHSKQLCLLRAKAWSFGYQYPGCPIVSAMARAALRLTRSYDQRAVLKMRNLSWYQREQYLDAFARPRPELDIPPTSSARRLMEDVFGVSAESQLAYESWFDQLTEIEPIPALMDFPTSWMTYNTEYVRSSISQAQYTPPEDWRKVHEAPLPGSFNVPSYSDLFPT